MHILSKKITRIQHLAFLFGIILCAAPLVLHARDVEFGVPSTGYVHHPPDPVNLQNGNFYLPVTDIDLPCAGFPLAIRRSYNSLSENHGAFGKGWSSILETELRVSQDSGLFVIEEDGYIQRYEPKEYSLLYPASLIQVLMERRKLEKNVTPTELHRFQKRLETDSSALRRMRDRYLKDLRFISPSDTYVSVRRVRSTVSKTESGYIRVFPDGRKDRFSNRGLLLAREDIFGNDLKIHYDAESRAQFLRNSCGQSLRLVYTRLGQVESVYDLKGKLIQYTYDSRGHLVSAIDSKERLVSYGYDRLARMTEVRFSESEVVRISYDRRNGRVSRQKGPPPLESKFRYGRRNGVTFAEVENEKKEVLRYEFHTSKNEIHMIDAKNQRTKTESHPEFGDLVSRTFPDGRKEHWEYDTHGRVTLYRGVDGFEEIYTYQGTEIHPFTLISSRLGKLQYEYDQRKILSFVEMTKDRLSLAMSAKGLLREIRNKANEVLSLQYNDFGQISQVCLKKKATTCIEVVYSEDHQISSVKSVPKNENVHDQVFQWIQKYEGVLEPAGVSLDISL